VTKFLNVNTFEMKNLLLFLLLFVCLSFYSCYKKSNKDILVGNWKFESISLDNTSENYIDFENSDSFSLNSTGHFDYSIENLSLVKHGKWDLKKDTLFLYYHQPDSTRIFIIEILSSNSLHLKEGNNFFKFRR